MAERKRYSDIERAQALSFLDANRGNYMATSKQTLIPMKTLAYWDKERNRQPEVAELRDKTDMTLRDLLEESVRKMIASTGEKVGEASLKDTYVSIGIALDKMLCLEEAKLARETEGQLSTGPAGSPGVVQHRVTIEYQDPPSAPTVEDND